MPTARGNMVADRRISVWKPSGCLKVEFDCVPSRSQSWQTFPSLHPGPRHEYIQDLTIWLIYWRNMRGLHSFSDRLTHPRQSSHDSDILVEYRRPPFIHWLGIYINFYFFYWKQKSFIIFILHYFVTILGRIQIYFFCINFFLFIMIKIFVFGCLSMASGIIQRFFFFFCTYSFQTGLAILLFWSPKVFWN